MPDPALGLMELRAELCLMSPTGWGSKHNIHVVDTNYEEYALVATQISKGTGSSTMVLLYSTSALGCLSFPWEKGRVRVISQAGVTLGG